MVKFVCSTSAAQGFAGLDPGSGHGTACQVTLRQRPTLPQLEGPATKIYNYVLVGFGEVKQKKKPQIYWLTWLNLFLGILFF